MDPPADPLSGAPAGATSSGAADRQQRPAPPANVDDWFSDFAPTASAVPALALPAKQRSASDSSSGAGRLLHASPSAPARGAGRLSEAGADPSALYSCVAAQLRHQVSARSSLAGSLR
jgi:hypothetical protein